jgi:diguanylate cyclase
MLMTCGTESSHDYQPVKPGILRNEGNRSRRERFRFGALRSGGAAIIGREAIFDIKSLRVLDDSTHMRSNQQVSYAARMAGHLPKVTVHRLFAALCTACLFLLSLLLANLVITQFPHHVTLTASVLLLAAAMIALFSLGAFARELIYWRRSHRSLAKLVNELRAGDAPIADLERIHGGARVMVEPVRAILLDLREQKRINADLHEEIRQRILSRTDALERQLNALKAQAARDGLTGLNNRRAFDTMMPQIFKACLESCEDLCVLMIDVDNFKPLNDTLGHAAGDEMLKAVAAIIQSSIREHDSAYRLGGDEFVIVMPRSSRAMGDKLGQRLGTLVDHLARPQKLALPPGLSVGVSALSDGKIKDFKALLELADRRLYEAKERKPNRHRRTA